MTHVIATHDFQPGGLDSGLAFLRRTRAELRTLRLVRLWPDRFQVLDVNKDCFEVRGLGYSHPEVVAFLEEVNAAFDPATLHQPAANAFKEFATGRRHPWAHDRVM